MDYVDGVLFVSLSAWAALAAWCHWRQGVLEWRIRQAERDAIDREAVTEAALTEVLREVQDQWMKANRYLLRRIEAAERRDKVLGHAHRGMPMYVAVPDPRDGEVH